MSRLPLYRSASVATPQSSTLDLCDLIDLLTDAASPPRDESPILARQRIDARVRQLGEQAARVRRVLNASDQSARTDIPFPRLAQ